MDDAAIIRAICRGGKAEHDAFLFLHNSPAYQTKAYHTVNQYKSLRLESWRDIFHESLSRLIHQIKAKKFDKARGAGKESKLIFFFQGICKYTCSEKIRKERKEEAYPVLELPPKQIEDLQTPLTIAYSEELKELLQEALAMLTDKCQHLLKLWSLHYSSDEIAELAGLKKGASTRNTIKRCKTNLRLKLRNSPQLLNALKELRWI